MTKTHETTVTGSIVAIQEERFRLIGREGQGYLLTLANPASNDLADLERWRRDQMLVSVRFSGEPNLASGVARSVRPSAGSE